MQINGITGNGVPPICLNADSLQLRATTSSAKIFYRARVEQVMWALMPNMSMNIASKVSLFDLAIINNTRTYMAGECIDPVLSARSHVHETPGTSLPLVTISNNPTYANCFFCFNFFHCISGLPCDIYGMEIDDPPSFVHFVSWIRLRARNIHFTWHGIDNILHPY